jgi:3-oxoacyl-[acyl-carrier protein] reductase
MTGIPAREAIVVGGVSGIGRALAHALAADDCRVTVADRNTDGAHAVAAELGTPHTAATADVTGSFLVIKHAAPRLRDGGALVSLSSLNGRQPAAAMSANCAAKAGLSMLTQVAALELAPHGIRVNAVAPGFVHTPLTEPATQIPGVLDDYLENTPLGRAGTAEEVAEAVVFLRSPKTSWLTGEVLDLNGGAHLRRYPDVYSHVKKLAAQ